MRLFLIVLYQSIPLYSISFTSEKYNTLNINKIIRKWEWFIKYLPVIRRGRTLPWYFLDKNIGTTGSSIDFLFLFASQLCLCIPSRTQCSNLIFIVTLWRGGNSMRSWGFENAILMSEFNLLLLERACFCRVGTSFSISRILPCLMTLQYSSYYIARKTLTIFGTTILYFLPSIL